MAQAGYSTIQLYYTTTGGAAPVAGNLLPGEFGFNINNADFALYAENASGTVTRLMNNPAGLKYPTADGTASQVLTTNGSGVLSFSNAAAGDVTLNGVQTLTNKTLSTSTTLAADVTGGDFKLTRTMLIDCGNTVVAKGNSGTSTQTYDYAAGSVQTSTATGNHTLATSNWPPTGNLGVILIFLTNGGAFTLTMPSINWIQPSGVVTTSFSTYLASLGTRGALQSSGTDQILWWSYDAGATIYGKLV
jgi:hypothetical protein